MGTGLSMNALQIAQTQGTPEIVALLKPRAKPAAVEAPASVGTAPALLLPASADAAPVDFSKLPPELLTEMDAEVAKLPVSAEQNSWRATIWRVSTSRSRPWPTPSSPNNAG